MSTSVNQVFLSGASGKDPEIRSTAGGTLVAIFSIATSESRKDSQGNWKDDTTWHNIKAFGRLAEITREQINKGTKVFIEGKLTTESWDDKATGQKRYKTVIIANYLSVIPSARSLGATNEPAAASAGKQPTTSRESLAQSAEITDDDIPF